MVKVSQSLRLFTCIPSCIPIATLDVNLCRVNAVSAGMMPLHIYTAQVDLSPSYGCKYSL